MPDYLLFEEFLEPNLIASLYAFATAYPERFVASTVSTGDTSYRVSSVLYEFPQMTAIRERISLVLPHLLGRLGIDLFKAQEIECQMTAHGDGHYFRRHNDSGSPDTASRVLSYVLYFHKQPKPWTGGEFCLYGDSTTSTISPSHNSLLVFPSCRMHEVMPVSVPSMEFSDGRFTVNGWVRS